MVELYNFTQLIKTPKRITDTSQTLLDHIYTNKPEHVCGVKVPVYVHKWQIYVIHTLPTSQISSIFQMFLQTFQNLKVHFK